jgi:predicted Zn-dependent peptidase
MIGGDTSNPEQLVARLKEMLFAVKNSGLTNEALQRTKKKKIGGFLRAVNSPEFIANQFTRYAFNEMNLFDVVPTLEKITIDDVQRVANEFISEERLSVCQVIPKKK